MRQGDYRPGWRHGFRPAVVFRSEGFTLLELLVALVLFAVLSLLTYNSLRAMIESNRQISLEGERLAAVQMALARIGMDIQQAQSRSVRDEYGNRQPAMVYALSPSVGLEFTRGGWTSSTAARAGSKLQRVRFLHENHELIRESWPFLDRGLSPKTFRQSVLDRVAAFEVRFVDEKGVWHNHWPPEGLLGGGAGPQLDERLPVAVEVWLELEDWGRLRRLFPLTGLK